MQMVTKIFVSKNDFTCSLHVSHDKECTLKLTLSHQHCYNSVPMERPNTKETLDLTVHRDVFVWFVIQIQKVSIDVRVFALYLLFKQSCH